ncbi:mRNA 3'-end-processing protein Rna15p [Trichomonascus vanleenenianus]|uniref:Rna15p n=1 Tax=Trichomonascus vanleenenianus TaxID=2268995 RepID=UPI003EC9FE04
MSDKGSGRVVYVGSIPYDQTEEQVLDIFRSVGPVANFRLVFDKDTGKSKGFGFVEYHDAETAASAVRNLNNYQIGQRNLRVDFSHETSIGPNVFTSKSRGEPLPQLPNGQSLPPGVTATEAITRTLNGFSRQRNLQIITDLKSVINNNTPLAIELFRTSPQLAFAAVQSLLSLQLVNPQVISGLIDQSQQQPAPPPPPPSQHTQQAPIQSLPAPPIQQQQQQPPMPPQQQQYQPSGGSAQPDESQLALIKQVMGLTDMEVEGLPADQREVVKMLREKVRTGEIRI